MKFTVTIEIDLPRSRVIELFDNPENMPYWQKGFISMEHLSGEPGQEGAKSKLHYKMGNREIEMVETITVRNLPYEFSGTYDADGVHNLVKNTFEEINETTTRWTSYNEFHLKGFMKIMGWIMPGAFKKQSLNFLEDFKSFAENQKN